MPAGLCQAPNKLLVAFKHRLEVLFGGFGGIEVYANTFACLIIIDLDRRGAQFDPAERRFQQLALALQSRGLLGLRQLGFKLFESALCVLGFAAQRLPKRLREVRVRLLLLLIRVDGFDVAQQRRVRERLEPVLSELGPAVLWRLKARADGELRTRIRWRPKRRPNHTVCID